MTHKTCPKCSTKMELHDTVFAIPMSASRYAADSDLEGRKASLTQVMRVAAYSCPTANCRLVELYRED
jgi:hypothetical protein